MNKREFSVKFTNIAILLLEYRGDKTRLNAYLTPVLRICTQLCVRPKVDMVETLPTKATSLTVWK